jgi:hypothetical protein
MNHNSLFLYMVWLKGVLSTLLLMKCILSPLSLIVLCFITTNKVGACFVNI